MLSASPRAVALPRLYAETETLARPTAWPSLAHKVDDLIALALRAGATPELRHIALMTVRGERTPDGAAVALHAAVQRDIGYWREPGEQLEAPEYVLRAGGADCDGHAALMAALLESLQLPWGLVLWSRPNEPPEHVTAALRVGNAWQNLETTKPVRAGWTPPGWVGRLATPRARPHLTSELATTRLALGFAPLATLRSAARSVAGAARDTYEMAEDVADAVGSGTRAAAEAVYDGLSDAGRAAWDCATSPVDCAGPLAEWLWQNVVGALADWAQDPATWRRLVEVLATTCAAGPIGCLVGLVEWTVSEAVRLGYRIGERAWSRLASDVRDRLADSMRAQIGDPRWAGLLDECSRLAEGAAPTGPLAARLMSQASEALALLQREDRRRRTQAATAYLQAGGLPVTDITLRAFDAAAAWSLPALDVLLDAAYDPRTDSLAVPPGYYTAPLAGTRVARATLDLQRAVAARAQARAQSPKASWVTRGALAAVVAGGVWWVWRRG